MLARMSYFSSLATSALFFAFLSMPSPAQAAPSLNPRQPTPNPLDWLDLNASGVYQSPEDVPPDEECGVALSGGSLFFPNARINQQDGKIACDHVRLKFSGMTTGFAFQVIAVHLDGRATLGQSAFLDTAEVGVGYFPASGSGSTEPVTDVAVEDLSDSYSGGYDGMLNLLLNVFPPEGSSRTTRGKSACPSPEEQPEIEVNFALSASHDGADADGDASVSNVSFGFTVMWEQCD